jgi:hypothetical protein
MATFYPLASRTPGYIRANLHSVWPSAVASGIEDDPQITQYGHEDTDTAVVDYGLEEWKGFLQISQALSFGTAYFKA